MTGGVYACFSLTGHQELKHSDRHFQLCGIAKNFVLVVIFPTLDQLVTTNVNV